MRLLLIFFFILYCNATLLGCTYCTLTAAGLKKMYSDNLQTKEKKICQNIFIQPFCKDDQLLITDNICQDLNLCGSSENPTFTNLEPTFLCEWIVEFLNSTKLKKDEEIEFTQFMNPEGIFSILEKIFSFGVENIVSYLDTHLTPQQICHEFAHLRHLEFISLIDNVINWIKK